MKIIVRNGWVEAGRVTMLMDSVSRPVLNRKSSIVRVNAVDC